MKDQVDGWEELRDLLFAWNPIGVDGLPRDEYDCVIGPLVDHLHKGESEDQLIAFLTNAIKDHFGLDPAESWVSEATGMLAARAILWFSDLGENLPTIPSGHTVESG